MKAVTVVKDYLLASEFAVTPFTPVTIGLRAAEREDVSLAHVNPVEEDPALGHEVLVLRQVLAIGGHADAIDPHDIEELGSRSLPLHGPRHHEVQGPQDVVGDVALLELLLAGLLDELPDAVGQLDLVLLEIDIASGDGQRRVLGCSVEVAEHHGAVGGAGNSVGAADGVENVLVSHLAVVVDAEDGGAVRVRELLQGAHIRIVRGVGHVASTLPDHLQGVDYHELGLRVCLEEALELGDQVVVDLARGIADMKPRAGLVRELPEPLLDPFGSVFQ